MYTSSSVSSFSLVLLLSLLFVEATIVRSIVLFSHVGYYFKTLLYNFIFTNLMAVSKYAKKYINKYNTTTKKERKRRKNKNLDCLAISRHK